MIYFVQSGQYVKIGFTSNIETRSKGYITENPNPVVLIAKCNGGYDVENKIHKQLEEFHHRLEWFKLTKESKELIDQIIKENSNNIEPTFKKRKGEKSHMKVYRQLKTFAKGLTMIEITQELKEELMKSLGIQVATLNKHIYYLYKLRKLTRVDKTYYIL